MGPKKRAEKIVKKFTKRGVDQETAKEYAIVVVNQIMEALDEVLYPNPFKQYWNQVKQETENL